MPTPSTSEIRTWALQQGHPVGDRGRISATVVEAYTQAHKTTRPDAARSTGKGKRASAVDRSAARISALEAEVERISERLGVLEVEAKADREQRAASEAGRPRRRFGRS